MKLVLAFLALITCLVGTGGMAQAHDVVGVGVWSCAAWTDARKNLRSDTTEQWALGFLSGIGFAQQGVDPLRDLAPQAVSEWLDKYCRSNPKDTIAHAAAAFSATRHVFSAPSASETVVVPAGSR
jgi:hypothetical protein